MDGLNRFFTTRHFTRRGNINTKNKNNKTPKVTYSHCDYWCFGCLAYISFSFLFFYFTILYWFCHTLTGIHHRCVHFLFNSSCLFWGIILPHIVCCFGESSFPTSCVVLKGGSLQVSTPHSRDKSTTRGVMWHQLSQSDSLSRDAQSEAAVVLFVACCVCWFVILVIPASWSFLTISPSETNCCQFSSFD